MEKQTILSLKQNLRELLETLYVMQREYRLLARHTSDDSQANGYNQLASNAESTAYSIDQLLGALNEDDEDLLRALKDNPRQFGTIKNQVQSLEREVNNLQNANSLYIDSLIKAIKSKA